MTSMQHYFKTTNKPSSYFNVISTYNIDSLFIYKDRNEFDYLYYYKRGNDTNIYGMGSVYT